MSTSSGSAAPSWRAHPKWLALGTIQSISSYVFAVGTSSSGGEIFHTFGRVQVSPDTGSVELKCPSRWPWRWEHLCDGLARPGAPPKFYPVTFVPTMKPSDDRACATVVRRLKERAVLP